MCWPGIYLQKLHKTKKCDLQAEIWNQGLPNKMHNVRSFISLKIIRFNSLVLFVSIMNRI
jgi:hypothetical protein